MNQIRVGDGYSEVFYKDVIRVLAVLLLMLLFIGGFSAPANADLRNGLVGWWKLNEGSGSTVIDWSGNNNNGSFVNSPTWVSNCARGGCIGFDGAANRYVNLGASTTFNTLQVPLTISGWFLKTSSSPSLQTIFGQYFATSGHNLLKLVRIDSGVLKYYAATSGGGFQFAGTFTPALNLWHFFAVVVGGDVTSPTLSIYLDNQVESPGLAALSSSPSSSVSVYIGSNSAQVNEYFSGDLDDIRIYNRALSSSEIADLYRSGAVIKNAVLRNARINQ